MVNDCAAEVVWESLHASDTVDHAHMHTPAFADILYHYNAATYTATRTPDMLAASRAR